MRGPQAFEIGGRVCPIERHGRDHGGHRAVAFCGHRQGKQRALVGVGTGYVGHAIDALLRDGLCRGAGHDGAVHDRAERQRTGHLHVEQLLAAQGCQLVEQAVGVHAEVLGQLRGDGNRRRRDHGAGVGDRLVIEAVGRRRGDETVHRSTAGGFAEDRHVARIAAVVADVLTHPFERQNLIADAVGGRAVIVVAMVGEVEKAGESQPVVDGHDNHVSLGGERRAVVVVARPGAERATMDPEEHRPPAVVATRCVDVQEQAVFIA